MRRLCASRTISQHPVRTQEKTTRASPAWRDTRPHALKTRLSPSRETARLSGLEGNSLLSAQWVQDTRKPHGDYRDRAGCLPRHREIPGRSRWATLKQPRRPTYLREVCRDPIRSVDRCAPDTSRRFSSTFRYIRSLCWHGRRRVAIPPPELDFRGSPLFVRAEAIHPPD